MKNARKPSANCSGEGERADEDMERLLNTEDIARLCGVKPSWIGAKVRQNEIPHYRLGHYVKFSESEVRDWLKRECRKHRENPH